MRRLWAGALGVTILVVLAGWAMRARTAAWHALAQAAETVRPTALAVPAGGALPARRDAAAVLAAIVADRGSAAGVGLSVRPLPAIPTGFAAVDVDAYGPEGSLRALARAVESQRPIVRFVRWSIRPAANGSLRLEARAVAPVARTR